MRQVFRVVRPEDGAVYYVRTSEEEQAQRIVASFARIGNSDANLDRTVIRPESAMKSPIRRFMWRLRDTF